MRQRNYFIVSRKNYVVLAYDRTAADSVNCDVALVALCLTFTAVYKFSVGFDFPDFLRQHQRCAGRSVRFLVMMLFYDFYVKAIAKRRRSLFNQI